MESIEYLFLLFIIYSFIGWLMEVLVTCIDSKKIVNRGFLIGPYCPIYGFGGVIITIVLSNCTPNVIAVFSTSFVICSILEYVTSYVMEKVFKARWWDYSHMKFNLNGRISLGTSLFFGIGGLAIYFINPLFFDIFSGLSKQLSLSVIILFLILFLIDNILSFKIILSFKNIATSTCRDNTLEITQKVKDVIISSKSILKKRLINAFPNVKAIIMERGKK